MRGTWNRFLWGQGTRGEEVEQKEARNIANLSVACACRSSLPDVGERQREGVPVSITLSCILSHQGRGAKRDLSEPRAWCARHLAPSGFTLLEVLVAMAVLSVALVGLLGLYNRSLLLTAQAQRLTTATLLAQEVLSRTQLDGINASQPGAGDFADLHPGRYPEFRWYRTIQVTPLEDLWEVRVGVAWGGREDEACELTLFMPLHRD
jgi:general secretion pathway protein I